MANSSLTSSKTTLNSCASDLTSLPTAADRLIAAASVLLKVNSILAILSLCPCIKPCVCVFLYNPHHVIRPIHDILLSDTTTFLHLCCIVGVSHLIVVHRK